MSRIIDPDSPAKERNHLIKAIALALRMLAKETKISQDAQDMAAFIALALEKISKSIDGSVSAWEKRGYWVKADKFRMQWIWTTELGECMKKGVLNDDWATVALCAGKILQHVSSVPLTSRLKDTSPWNGAWSELISRSKSPEN